MFRDINRIKINIISNFFVKMWAAAIFLAFIPLYIKFLGIESYGLVGVFFTIQTVVSFFDLGLSPTLNRELARLTAQGNKEMEMRNLVLTLERVYWVIALIIGLSVVIFASFISQYWIRSEKLTPLIIKKVVMMMGITLAFQWPISLYSGGLIGLQRQVLLNKINISISTFRSVGMAVILWKISPTIQTYFAWQMVSGLIQVFIIASFLWKSLPEAQLAPKFDLGLLKNVWRFAAGMTAITITSIILTQVDKLILSKLLTLEAFGYYSVATTILTVLPNVVNPISTAVYPALTQSVSLGYDLKWRRLYHQSCQLVAVFVFPICLSIIFFSKEVLYLWTGNAVIAENSNLILCLLTIGSALNELMTIPFFLQYSYGKTRYILIINLISVIVMVPTVYYMTGKYGAIGAGIAWILLNCGYVLLAIPLMYWRLFKEELFQWYIMDVGVPLVFAAVPVISGKWIINHTHTRIMFLFNLSIIAMLSLLAAVMATPHLRSKLMRR